MDNLTTIAGKNGCGDSSVALGKKGCQIPFGTPKHAIRLKKGTVIPGSTVFNLAFISSLILSGTAIALIGSTGFERLSGEDAMSTTSDTTERLNVLGLPKYKLTFQEGHEFYRQMSKLTGFKNSEWIIMDEAGRMKIAINSNGDFVGFSAGQVLAEQTMEKVQGGDGESKAVTIQFINRKQWDSNYTIVTDEELGFDWEEVESLNSVELSFITVPSVGDTTIVFSALLSADRDTHVEGLEVANVKISVNGVSAVIASLVENASTKRYTATIPALTLGQLVDLSLWNNALALRNIDLEGNLFTSVVASEVVIA